MRTILKLKSWILFIIGFAIMLIPYTPIVFGFKFPLMRLFAFTIQLIWLYSIVNYFSKTYSIPGDKSLNKFKASILLCFIGYIHFNLLGEYMDLNGLYYEISPILGALIFFVTFIYIISVCAKTIKAIEEASSIKRVDYISYVLLLFFFPIGVWIIQPKVNKFVDVNV